MTWPPGQGKQKQSCLTSYGLYRVYQRLRHGLRSRIGVSEAKNSEAKSKGTPFTFIILLKVAQYTMLSGKRDNIQFRDCFTASVACSTPCMAQSPHRSNRNVKIMQSVSVPLKYFHNNFPLSKKITLFMISYHLVETDTVMIQ